MDKLCGFYPPDIVARQRDLTDGQKRLYERAVRWAGRSGSFWYAFETMAEALGKSARQVKSDMVALEAAGLIQHRRRHRLSNLYTFLWHRLFEVQSTALQATSLRVQDLPLEVQNEVILEVQPTAQESSPLESRSFNFGKADIKLIPDDASQKARSAASPCVMTPDRTAEDGTTRTDSPCPPRSTPSPGVAPGLALVWSSEELMGVRRLIVALWDRET